ncbi:MAG TPA: D-Ala-D-Ala carboxypeptidase family metallohydrolase, partial [Gemmatimonadaceae bacterium]|nr:D-Ala-D-Ala carboxypeptidase family metallohydrolase [Gemmatimonadaceae bacterium]
PQRPLLSAPLALGAAPPTAGAPATPFGRIIAASVERGVRLRMRFALPGDTVVVPLALTDAATTFRYMWLRVADSSQVESTRPLTSAAALVAPGEPGFYRLALDRHGDRRIVDGVVLSVLVPFSEKKGPTLRGFRIGSYVGERLGGAARRALPEGFFPVDSAALALHVSDHLTLRDVLTTPDVDALGYPQYATLDLRLVEKLELVLREVERLTGGDVLPRLTVNSGFRPPSYNRTVRGAAPNSRHQYGDAADVRVDVNHDGRFSLAELRLVARAVSAVERAHPDLVGGLGLYTSKRYRSPYVHIDARGKTARWTG